jgi:adenylate cyclase
MPSVIPGYEYDIFISYRHNDNRSGWVTEFLAALQEELAATIKEPVSVYFDTNPHDGLLETHNVDKSLEAKLKCLIFIPIISQTYCDPKSFAWQHEFITFNKMAKEDQFGRDIKLTNGNVASRILPVKIHDLDHEDNSILEHELDGFLRAIEFIYKSPGVNRPLSTTDKKEDNSNRTLYRDQVNKMANGIKEIFGGLKHPAVKSKDVNSPQSSDAMNVDSDKSIAVLPFTDMSPGQDQEYLGDGLAEEILNSLVTLKGLKVSGRTSSFQFKGQSMGIREISEKLQVKTVLEGSVRKQGNRVRITAQLINASDGFHLWSERYDRELDDIFAIQDDIASNIANHLKLTFFGDKVKEEGNVHTRNVEAFEMLLRGRFFIENRTEGIEQAMQCFQKALEIDPDYADAYLHVGLIYFMMDASLFMPFAEGFEKARDYFQKALDLDPYHAEAHELMAFFYMWYEFDWDKAESEFKKIKDYENYNSQNISFMAFFKAFVYGDFDFAISVIKRQIASDPLNPDHILTLMQMYCYSGNYEKVRSLGEKFLTDYPDHSDPVRYIGRSYMFEGRPEEAIPYFRKAVEISQTKGYSMKDLIAGLIKVGEKEEAQSMIDQLQKTNQSHSIGPAGWCYIYSLAGDLDKAFMFLEKGIREKDFWVFTIKYSQDWDAMRNDPRFDKVLKQMNFPE